MKEKIYSITAGLVLILSCAGLQAVDSIHISMDEAVTAALQNAPALKAVKHASNAALKSARAATRKRFGELDAVGWYSRYHDDQIVRPIAPELLAGGFGHLPFDRNQVHYGATFDLPLYLGGELTHSIKIARVGADQAALLAKGTTWQIRHNTIALYSALGNLDQVAIAMGEEVKALEKTKERLDLMVESGKRPELDRLKVIEQLESARSQRADVFAKRRRVKALLLALLGKDPTLGLIVDPLPDHLPQLKVDESTLHAMVKEASVVRRADLNVIRAASGLKIATSAFLPKVLISGLILQNSAPSLDDPLDTWEFRVGVKIPLFAGGSRFEEVGAAKEKLQSSREMKTKELLQRQAQLEDALGAFAAAKENVRAATARRNAGVEAARIEQIRYETGADTIEDLLRARAREEGARSALARARAELMTAASRLNTIVEREVAE